MGMAEDVSYIKNLLNEIASTEERGLDNIYNKLRHDIEPKLDKALEGQSGPVEAKKDPNDVARNLKCMVLYAATERKIESIKALREATGLGLKEAKDVVDWIEARLNIVRQQAIAKYTNKEAE